MRTCARHGSRLAWPSLILVAVACNGGTQPPQGGGPEFVINSPPAGSLTAGTFFLSVQALDPAEVTSVAFSAAGVDLGSDASAADGFRVFVSAADLPAGSVDLTATATGTDGRQRTRSVTVTNVPAPGSTAVVGSAGAALGTVEDNGAMSVLVLPPGTAEGTTVSFEARTQDEVKAATGVDYDALGVTFLGAQDIVSSTPLDRSLMVSSGGFGPQVQPGHAVVNYLIGPDVDGDGVGEVMVINSASVAPNGDVISDPVPVMQVGSNATSAIGGTLRAQQLGDGLRGPPGTILDIPVAGFNASSPFGSIARFTRGADVIEMVGTIHVSQAGAQTFTTIIPPLPPGSGSLTLLNVGSGDVSEPIPLTIQAAPAVTGDPAAVIADAVDAMLAYTSTLAALPGSTMPEESQRVLDAGESLADIVDVLVARFQDPGYTTGAEDLAAFASLLTVADVKARFDALRLDLTSTAVRPAQGGPCDDALDRADKAFNAISNGSSALDIKGKNPSGFIQSWMIGQGWGAAKGMSRDITSSMGAEPCDPPPPPPPGPGGRGSPSGMGSAPPPGGPISGGSWSGGSRYLRADPFAEPSISDYQERPGRFVVKLSVQGNATRFTGVSDASGYFYIPLVPAGEPFIATAIDTDTGELRTVEGVGPALGESRHIAFDFTAGAATATFIAWDGGGDGQDWHDPLNWDEDRLPLPSDQVTIDQPAADVVIDLFNLDVETIRSLRLLQGALTVESGNLELLEDSRVAGTLSLAGGDLMLAADLTVEGVLDWVSGTITGPGEVRNEGQTIVTSAFGVRELVGGSFTNAGLVRVTGEDFGGALRLGAGTVFDNVQGATFELDGDVSLAHTSGGDRPVFHNRGTILRSGEPGDSSFMAVLHNHDAAIRVDNGSLWLYYGGSFAGGDVQVAAGATLDVGLYQGAGTTLTELSGIIGGDGAGQFRLVGGNFAVAAAGATFDFDGGGVYWRSGAVEGPGALRNDGLLTIAQVIGGTTRELRTRLVNAGTVELVEIESNIGLKVGHVAAFENLAGAVFDFTSDIDILNSLDLVDGEVPFVNAGTLIKSGGDGVSLLEVCYEQVGDGTIEEVTGSFEFLCSSP